MISSQPKPTSSPIRAGLCRVEKAGLTGNQLNTSLSESGEPEFTGEHQINEAMT